VNLKLETLTPIFIGTGEEISPIEYFIEQNTIYRVNMEKIARLPSFDSTQFASFIKDNNPPYFGDFDQTLGKTYYHYNLEADPTLIDVLISQKDNIKEQIKTGNHAYIPGSSLKGAIYSAMWWYFLKDSSDKDLRDVVTACLRGGFIPRNSYNQYVVFNRKQNRPDFETTLKNIVFSKLIDSRYLQKIRNSDRRIKFPFLSWIKVSDCLPQTIENLKLEQIELKGSRRILKEFVESIKEKTIFNLTLRNYHSIFVEEKEVLEVSDQFYSKVLEKDIEWCEHNGFDGTSLEMFRGQKYKIKIGQTTSSWSTSSLILAEELGILNEYIQNWRKSIGSPPYHFADLPLTRKVIDSAPPLMGWVKITL